MGALKSKFFRSKSGSGKTKDDKTEKQKKQKGKKTVNLPESQSARKTVDPRLPFTNYRQIFSIRNAWKPVQRSMEECATETFIRFLTKNPKYKERFSNISGVVDRDLEDLRKQQDFEDKAMDIYAIFDGVISNLETVDKALQEIQLGTPATQFSKKMLQDYEEPFVDTIRLTLGSDRFTQTTEDNFHTLYRFVREQMCSDMEDEPEEEVNETMAGDEEEVADTQVEVNLCDADAT